MENSTRFKTNKNARFSFVKLIEKGKFGKYEVSVLIPKSDTASYKAMEAAVEAAKLEAKDKKWGGKIPTKFKYPAINDGDEKLNKDEEPDEVYAGHWYLTAKSSEPVYTCNAKNERIDPKEIYSGCYGIASVNFYGYDFEGTKGIGVELRGIQFIKDGEPLGGKGGNAANDFEEFDDEDVDI